MTDAPEHIWLLPHDGEQRCWCDDPDPGGTGHGDEATAYVRADLVAALEAEITYPDFIHSILCDVQDYDTSLHDYARAVSSVIRLAFRKALHSTEASHE